MYKDICIYIHTHIHICLYIYIYENRPWGHRRWPPRGWGTSGPLPRARSIFLSIYIYTFMYLHIHLHIYLFTYTCICTYIYIYICMYTHTHTHLEDAVASLREAGECPVRSRERYLRPRLLHPGKRKINKKSAPLENRIKSAPPSWQTSSNGNLQNFFVLFEAFILTERVKETIEKSCRSR